MCVCKEPVAELSLGKGHKAQSKLSVLHEAPAMHPSNMLSHTAKGWCMQCQSLAQNQSCMSDGADCTRICRIDLWLLLVEFTHTDTPLSHRQRSTLPLLRMPLSLVHRTQIHRCPI